VVARPLTLLAALALSACTAPELATRGNAQPVVMPAYDGGRVDQFASLAQRWHATGRPIHIASRCDSACAILASLPTACLTRTGSIGLHKPSLAIVTGGQVYFMGPDDNPQFYSNVTPRIAATVRAMEYNWSDPTAFPVRVTYRTAPQYGVKQCE